MPDPNEDDPPHDARSLAVLFLLAAVGGFGDAGAYVLAGTFTGHLTGNTVLIAVHLSSRQWKQACTCGLAVVTFLVGTVAGDLWDGGRVGGGGTGLRQLRWPLAVQIALFAAGWLTVGPIGRPAMIGCLCVALGLQNGTLQRLAMLSVHTTYMTGMSTKLARATVAAVPADAARRRRRRTFAALIASFVVGAAAGSVLTARDGDRGFVFIAVPAAVALTLCATAPAER